MYGNAMFGGQNFGNIMQSAQDNFAGSIPPINVGYYNAADNNPATYQPPPESQQMDPMQYQQYMLQQYQQQMNPQQQMDPQQYQQQMQQQYQQQQYQQPSASGQQMDPYEYQQYMQQQYQQQINPQQPLPVQPQQVNTGIAAQLQNEPLRFRNPDFYSDQQYLGYQETGTRRQTR
jgi:hypothetical protein